jgi:hypothetical protein
MNHGNACIQSHLFQLLKEVGWLLGHDTLELWKCVSKGIPIKLGASDGLCLQLAMTQPRAKRMRRIDVAQGYAELYLKFTLQIILVQASAWAIPKNCNRNSPFAPK